MKKLITGLLASVLLASSLPALADRHGPGGYYYGPPPPRHHHHERHRSPGPLVWGVAGLALGTMLYSIATPPVVVAPAMVAPPPRPPVRMAYFCASYQAYYPNVQYCPEGWQAVPTY